MKSKLQAKWPKFRHVDDKDYESASHFCTHIKTEPNLFHKKRSEEEKERKENYRTINTLNKS